MRRAGAIAAVLGLMLASAVAGCGGSGTSASPPATTATTPNARPSPAARARHHHRRRAELGHVREAELVRGRAGWARNWLGVWWTADGGRHWRRITPPAPSPTNLEGVFFRDPRHGWAFAEEGHEGDEHPVFFATVDGGRHWTRSPTPIEGLLRPAAEASFSAIGGGRVFALVRQEGDTAEDFGWLLRSEDGGRSWERTAKPPPQAGRIAFESARDGWLAGGYPKPRLWRTLDGGRDWTEVPVPTPLAVKRVDSISYLPPRIGTDGHGLLAAVVVARPTRDTTAVLYSTADRGRRWRIAATKRLPGAGGWLEAARVLALRGGRGALARPPVGPLTTVLTANGRGPTRRARNLADWTTMSFSGRRFGFAYSPFGHDPELLFTADGGRDWRRVAPVRASSPLPPPSRTGAAPAQRPPG